MPLSTKSFNQKCGLILLTAIVAAMPVLVQAQPPAQAPPPPYPQAPPPYPQAAPPPMMGPGQLDQLVSRIALYPDPLLAQIMTASSFSNEIPDAAGWADQHHYLQGDQLAAAISADQLPWDPSVQALLPFPSVLDMMATDMGWTQALGNAVLSQRGDVMDAVQRERHKAYQFGYLRSNAQIVVTNGPYIEIAPVAPGYLWVPYYDPAVVFFAPRPGFAVGLGIHFGFGIQIGAAFAPWGWGGVRFGWGEHAWFVGGVRWDRTWANRAVYVHGGYRIQRFAGARPAERHQLIGRSPREREAARRGERVEEHRGH